MCEKKPTNNHSYALFHIYMSINTFPASTEEIPHLLYSHHPRQGPQPMSHSSVTSLYNGAYFRYVSLTAPDGV